jgi:S1-C subfamily serine protease
MSKRSEIFILLILALALSGCTFSEHSTYANGVTQYAQPTQAFTGASDTELVISTCEESPSLVQVIRDDEQVISLYETASNAVVNITSISYVYNRMLGQLPEEGVGSGFIYDNSGHIITNYHVIANADELIITLATGEEYQAEVVGVDAVNDLAVISIQAGENLPAPLSLADSEDVRVGESVFAIGNPYGLDQTLTTGVVSALGRVIESTVSGMYIADAIQTDAAINPGNSGGPLLNIDGEVVGINSQIISNSGSSAGVGFAISANTIRRIVPEIITTGTSLHTWLGVQTIDLTAYSIAILTEAGMSVPVESGLLVVGLDRGSPAEKAGLSKGDRQVRLGPYLVPVGGDIITAIDDKPVNSQQDLMLYLEMHTTVGDVVELSVIRQGQTYIVPVTLTAQSTSSL